MRDWPAAVLAFEPMAFAFRMHPLVIHRFDVLASERMLSATASAMGQQGWSVNCDDHKSVRFQSLNSGVQGINRALVHVDHLLLIGDLLLKHLIRFLMLILIFVE